MSKDNQLGQPLRKRRQELGWSQDALSESAGVSLSVVKKIEYGGTASIDSYEAIAKALGMTLTVQNIGSSSKVASPVVSATGKSAKVVVEADVNRREFIKAAACSIALPPMLGAVEALDATPRAVGHAQVEELIDLRRALVGSDAVLGARPVMRNVVDQVCRIDRMVRGASTNILPQLLEVGAMFCEFAGWLADDLGEVQAGAFWTGRALGWAHASGNAGILAYVLQRQAQQAVLHGNGALAVALASSIPTKNVSYRVQAATEQQRAHGYALDRNEREAFASLDRAAGLLDVANEDKPSPFGLASWCTQAYLEAQRGACLTKVGKPKEAVQAFEVALKSWPETYRRERGLHLSRQAFALASAGEPVGASIVGREAIDVLMMVHSARALDELRKVDLVLTQCDSREDVVSEFRNQLMQLTA